jgi:hypothetical protein
MRPGRLLGLVLLAATLAAAPVRAEDAPAGCDVPASLLETESSLPKVEAAVKAGQPLDILVVGSRSSTIGSSDTTGIAYPARMQAALQEKLQEKLKDKLSQLAVNVSVEIQAKKTAEEVASEFVKLLEGKRPTLVIWQTGTVDAMRAIDPDDFRNAVDEGVVALQKAGADVILINPQYSPRTETMISVPPYLDNMRAVAQAHDIPVFDRFGIMHQWNDQGDFDLFGAHHGLEMAKRVHDCLGRALASFVVGAAHLEPAQQN